MSASSARAAVLVAVVGVLFGSFGTAAAQTEPGAPTETSAPADTGDSGAPALELVGQTSVTVAGGTEPMALFVQGINVADGSQIVVTPHKPLRTVAELLAVVDEQRSLPDALPQLAPLRFGDLPTEVGTPGRRIDVPVEAFRHRRDDPGAVYPLEVGVVGGRSLLTFAVVVSDRYEALGGQPFTIAWLWRMTTSGPAHEPGGAISSEAHAVLADAGAMGCFADVVAARNTVPLTFVPDPELIQAWRELRGPETPGTRAPGGGTDSAGASVGCGSAGSYTNFDELQNLLTEDDLGRHEVLAEPYVPLDLPAMAQANLGEEIGRQLTAGYDALTGSLGTQAAISSSTRMVERVDTPSLQELRNRGVNRVVVASDELEPVDTEGGVRPGRPTTLALADGTITTAVADTELPKLLQGEGPPAARAHRFLAACALAALERPTEQRGLVLGSRVDDHYDAALGQVLDLLSVEHSLLRMDTLSGYFRSVSVEQGEDALIQRHLAPVEPQPLAFNGATIVETRTTLESYRQWVGDGPAADVVAAGERSVLVAEHAGLSPDLTRRYHDEAVRPVNELIGQIHFADAPHFTITANKERIPVVFRNDSAFPVRVQVFLSGAKLDFPEGAVQVVDLPPGQSRQSFLVHAQSSGDTTLRLVVRSAPDGRIPIGESRVRIRNFGVSGLAVYITAGAAVFLAAWWMTHWRRNRRDRGPGSRPDEVRRPRRLRRPGRSGPIDQPA